MQRFVLGAAVFAMLLGPVGQAHADLITFEGLGNEGDAVTTIGIANFGNTILAEYGSTEVVGYISQPASGDEVIGPAGVDFGSFFITDPIISGNPFIPSPILITFDVPVTDVSFFVLDIDGAQVDASIIETVTAQIFDTTGLVDTLTVTDMVPGVSDGTGDSFGTLFAFNNSTPITTLTLQINLNGWGIDNLAFAPTPSPEPGTLLLLGTGFVGMGTMARRRSKRNGGGKVT